MTPRRNDEKGHVAVRRNQLQGPIAMALVAPLAAIVIVTGISWSLDHAVDRGAAGVRPAERLERFRIKGRVRAADDRTLIEGARVVARDAQGETIRRAETNRRGKYTMARLDEPVWTLVVRAAGFRNARRDFPGGIEQTERVDVSLERVGAGSSDEALDLLDTFAGVDGELAGSSPDASIAVGRDKLVVVRNTGIALFRKPSGSEPATVVAERRMSGFLDSVTAPSEGITDPVIVFDRETERFFLANAANGDCPTAEECVAHIQLAVSKTPSPMGLTAADWHFYALDRTHERTGDGPRKTENQGDFDHIAVVGDKLVIGWQAVAYHDPGEGDGAGRGGRIRVLDVQPLLEGDPPETWRDFITPGRPRPAIMYDVNDRATLRTRAFFNIHSRCFNGSLTWRLGAVRGLNGEPRYEERWVGGSTLPCTSEIVNSAPQRGDSAKVWIAHETTHPVYRDGSLWVLDLVTWDFGGGPVTALRWAEVDVSSWPEGVRILQSGVFGKRDFWIYGVQHAVDREGNLVIVYHGSGSDDFISSYYTGRLLEDRPGTLRRERLLRKGNRSFTNIVIGRNNFIDYPWVTVDPVDGSLWMVGYVPGSPKPSHDQPRQRSETWVGRIRPLGSTSAADGDP